MNYPIRLEDLAPTEQDRDTAKKAAFSEYAEQIQLSDVLEALAEHMPATHQAVLVDRLKASMASRDASGFDHLVIGSLLCIAVRNYVETMADEFEELKERRNMTWRAF